MRYYWSYLIFIYLFNLDYPALVQWHCDLADGDWADTLRVQCNWFPRDRKGFSGPGWMCPWTRLINHPIWQTTTERRYRESLEQGYAREAVSESVTGGKGYLESWKSLPVRFSRTKLSLIRATSQRSGVIVATLDKMWKSRVLLLPSPGGSDRGSLAISERTVSH